MGALKNPDEFAHALDTLPWPAPTVFLMRRAVPPGRPTPTPPRLAEDVYPNQPNVRRYTVDLDAGLFSDRHFTVTDIGPFVLAVRRSWRIESAQGSSFRPIPRSGRRVDGATPRQLRSTP